MDGPRRESHSVKCVRQSILGGAAPDSQSASFALSGDSALTILGLVQDLPVEPRRKAEDRTDAFRLEADEQDHLAVAKLIVLSDDVKLIGVERWQTLQVACAVLEGLEVAVCKVIEFGVHLFDGGEDHALRLADDRCHNGAVAIVIGGAVLLNERPELPGKSMEAGKSTLRQGARANSFQIVAS